MKKDLAIVFGVSDNYVFALANVLIGMKKHCKKFWDDIIVYHLGIDKETQDKLNQILDCTFINFENLSSKLKVNEEVKKEYSLLTFARFECFNLLNKYHKIIWQDVDILIKKDFSSLLSYGEKSGFAATLSVDGFYVESNFKKIIPEYEMFTPLYNAGIMCLSDKLKNYEIMAEWCYKKTCEYCDIIRFADQGIINLLIQEFNIEVEKIDILKYCCHPTKPEAPKATIVHAYGSNKFWNYDPYKKMFPEWWENNEEWKKISGDEEVLELQNQPLVSVIMSVYERYDYLKEAILSILKQTYTNLELIIVLEKSSKTNEIANFINNFNDNRIKVIKNKEKLGFAESLNVAIKNSKGKYIARMDDDDISLPTRLEKQVKFMEQNTDIDICGSYMQMFMKSNEICVKPLTDKELKPYSLTNNPFFHPTVIMRQEIFDKYNLYYSPDYFTEDYELWTRAMKYVKFANINEILLKYRASGENITIQKGENVHKSIIKVMSKCFKDTLSLDLTNNELELLYGKNNGLFNCLYNLDEAREIYDNILQKIEKANLKYNFFDQESLNNIFALNKNKPEKIKQNPVKKMVKVIFKPIYHRLMNRVENLINLKMTENNMTIDYKINNLKKEIEEKNEEL